MMEDDSPGMKRHSYNSALKLLQKHFPIFVYKDGKDHGYDVDLVMKHFINELRKVRVGGRAEKVLVEGWLNEWGRNHGWMIEVPESVSVSLFAPLKPKFHVYVANCIYRKL